MPTEDAWEAEPSEPPDPVRDPAPLPLTRFWTLLRWAVLVAVVVIADLFAIFWIG